MDNNSYQELHKKYRPSKFREVIGQPAAVAILLEMVKNKRVPHALIFCGQSGVGKTTMARILKEKLNCADYDFCEVNCAVVDGAIETVRGIQQQMHLAPSAGLCRIWLLDEIQSFSRTQFAQQALLKLLEDTPAHVYFFLCTTDPKKLIPTILSRCTAINLNPLPTKDLESLLRVICEKEHLQSSQAVLNKIVETSGGSAREALKLLNQVMGLKTEQEQLDAIQSSGVERQAIEIARGLMNPRMTWKDMAVILNGVDEEPEGLRHLVLAYATKSLLGNGGERAYHVINAFESNFYDSKKAGLVRACYEVVGKK